MAAIIPAWMLPFKNISYKIKVLRNKKVIKVRSTMRDAMSSNSAFFIVLAFSPNAVQVNDIVAIIPPFEMKKYSFAQVVHVNNYSSYLSTQGIENEKHKNPKKNLKYSVLKLTLLDNLQAVEKIHNAKINISKRSKKQK